MTIPIVSIIKHSYTQYFCMSTYIGLKPKRVADFIQNKNCNVILAEIYF